MPSFYVIETRQFQWEEWTDRIGGITNQWCNGPNIFKTADEAWLTVSELKQLDPGAESMDPDWDDSYDWAGADYRVAIYAGPEDDERLQGYYE
jgi:hypothetical protein